MTSFQQVVGNNFEGLIILFFFAYRRLIEVRGGDRRLDHGAMLHMCGALYLGVLSVYVSVFRV